MAERVGGDLVLQVLDELREARGELRDVRTDVREMRAEMDRKLAAQGDTIMLIASTVQRLTVAVKGRLDDHEVRISRLEPKAAERADSGRAPGRAVS